jgi:F0F1-type ATP synthase assembly protein I
MATNTASIQHHRQAYLLIGLQCSLLLLLAIGSLFYYKNTIVISMIGGGLSVILPTICFACITFYKIYKRSHREYLFRFYVGEIAKIILCVSLAFFMLIKLHFKPAPFFVGFLTTYLSIFLTPLIKIFKI